MVPAGYMAKLVRIPKGLEIPGIIDVYSVSSHVNENFADYISFWMHNGHWLFDSPEIIRTVAHQKSVSLEATSLFYYEVFEKEFDGAEWSQYAPEPSFPTNVVPPPRKTLAGFDVVTFFAKNAPECSPLSCNGMAKEIATNEHCLLQSFDDAYDKLSAGAFKSSEPGPYRIFSVYCMEWF
jgi:hypothetical protein